MSYDTHCESGFALLYTEVKLDPTNNAIAISTSLLEAQSKFLVSTTKTWIKYHYLYVTTNTLKCILKYIYECISKMSNKKGAFARGITPRTKRVFMYQACSKNRIVICNHSLNTV